MLAAIRDVTERREVEQRLRRQHDELIDAKQQLERIARFDSLTGLVNRREVISRLQGALKASTMPGTSQGVLFIDVDHFKEINDARGHAAGDAVLRTLAERISQCVRRGDTVGRLGGDEVLVLLPCVRRLSQITRVAEKIRARGSEPIDLGGETCHATLSIGATLTVPGESASDTLARADLAMYEAKRRGGNAVFSA